MDATQLYNGYHLQRRRLFIEQDDIKKIPRNNLSSQIELHWLQSLQHEQLSPRSKINKAREIEQKAMGRIHDRSVELRLSKDLKLNDSRVISNESFNLHESRSCWNKNSPHENSLKQKVERGKISKRDIKLPQINKSNPEHSIVTEMMGRQLQNSKGKYLKGMLEFRLRNYNHYTID